MKPHTSGLEQPACLQPFLLLLRDLHVARREEVDPIGDPRHRPSGRVGEPAREVDEATAQLGGDGLQVEDYRLVRLEAVADLLDVVEAARDDHVHPGRGRGPDGPYDGWARD